MDGKEVASKKIPHTIPFLMTFDETFDVGVDTRTGVDDNDYQLPFRFTGKLDKLTIKLVAPKRTAEEEGLQQKTQNAKTARNVGESPLSERASAWTALQGNGDTATVRNMKETTMKTTKLITVVALVALAFMASHATAQGQTDGAAGTPLVLPRPDFHFSGNVGRTYLDSAKPQFPQPVQAPKGAPNIVLILIDDAGFGQFSTFGGGVPSPTMDKLAAEGLRYNRFHTTALCSPTRAALITGRNHHSSATGVITELATGYDGYTRVMPRSHGSVGEVLRQNGYMTAWIGKNHNTPAWETSEAGPFDRWANGLGFDYFYGFNGGDMNHWNPILYENRNLVPASTDPNYYLTTDLADKAIAWVRKVKSIAPDRPFFLYVAPGATHAPHHAPKEWIDKFKGKFDMGWDQYREETFARQKKLGVIPPDTKLTKRSEGLPAWDSLNADQKRLYARMMEVFAGYGAHCRLRDGPHHRRRQATAGR